MRLKNILLVVEDVETSKEFYKELFGLQVLTDLVDKVIMTEGLVLHAKKSWEGLLGEPLNCGNMAELYFEERDMDGFLQKIQEYQSAKSHCAAGAKSELATGAEFITMPEKLQSPNRRVVQMKDPDGHLIEVAEV